MFCINNQNINPYFNLASEEYLLKNFEEEIFMLWRDEPSIIIGKHQNALAEINIDYVKENQIKVVRRLTGGGAVFHDLGNLNFTFISNSPNGKAVMDFEKYTRPIVDVLINLGIDAHFEGRNDIVIDGKKISGNAECVYRNRVLHHGTILYSAHLPNLSSALKVNPLKFQDKAVKSTRNRVANISDYLKKPMDVVQFRDLIFTHIAQMYADSKIYEFTTEDIAFITNLQKGKYETWEWNFGNSPEYNFRKIVKTSGGFIEFDLMVEKGIITSAKIFGDFFSSNEISEIETALKGLRHEYNVVKQKLEGYAIERYFNRATLDEVLEGIF
ncbi:MAG: lipoate--protein ligase [Lentimicrobium sp.]|jgi:lipoate-protein ligase A